MAVEVCCTLSMEARRYAVGGRAVAVTVGLNGSDCGLNDTSLPSWSMIESGDD